MKKLVIFCMLLGFSSSVFCQVQKSNWMLSGSLGYQSVKGEGESSSTGILDFSPKAGYFITNSILLGANFEVLSYNYDGGSSTQSLIGPFVRAYGKMKEGNSAAVFGEVCYNLGSDKSKYNGNTDKYKRSALSLGIGLAAFLGPNVAVEPQLSYRSDKIKFDETQFSPAEEYKAGTFGIDIGVSIYLGRSAE